MDTVDAGRLGGKKLLDKRGKEYFVKISKLGVQARKLKAVLPLDKQPRA